MLLPLLIDEIVSKLHAETQAGQGLAEKAASTEFVAQLAALDAARAGSVGRGLAMAAEELAELAELTAKVDVQYAAITQQATVAITELKALIDALPSTIDPGLEDTKRALLASKLGLEHLSDSLTKEVSSVPQSLGDNQTSQSADRIQIETMLRQALLNMRDRITALILIIDAYLERCQNAAIPQQLLDIDSVQMPEDIQRRLASLSRDKRLLRDAADKDQTQTEVKH